MHEVGELAVVGDAYRLTADQSQPAIVVTSKFVWADIEMIGIAR